MAVTEGMEIEVSFGVDERVSFIHALLLQGYDVVCSDPILWYLHSRKISGREGINDSDPWMGLQ